MTFIGLSELPKKKEIKKHIATIQCINTLSLLQRKIANVLLFHAYKNLQIIEEHHIVIKKLCELIGYKGNNHAVIKAALKGLIATVVEWNLFEEEGGKEDWTASSILASVHIKGSSCHYSYSLRMRDLLYSPRIYAKINLIVQSKFKSGYGLALYENCVRYQGLPHTKWFDFEVFKKLMGVPAETYAIFRDFKRRVLDKSINEVNKYSDLFINSEIERAGRKITRIRFTLFVREKKKCFGLNFSQKNKDDKYQAKNKVGQGDQLDVLTKKLAQTFLLNKNKIELLIQRYSIDYLNEKVKLVEASASYKSNNINNLTGYFLNAIKNDYKNITIGEIISQKSKEAYHSEEKKRHEEKTKELLQRNYEGYLYSEFDKAILCLPHDARENLINVFEKYLEKNNNFLLPKYKTQGFNSRMVKVFFRLFVKENYINFMPSVISFEDFCNT